MMDSFLTLILLITLGAHYVESSNCGISPVKGARIIGGKNAIAGAWPWMASFGYFGGHHCGGTLLTPKWVLTASHCVTKVTEENVHKWTVKMGAHNFFQREPSVQVRKVKRVIRSPNWNPKTFIGDHTLLEMESPFVLNKRVNVACLPEKGVYPPIGKECLLTGWGSLYYPGGSVSAVLQQTTLPVVERRKCRNHSEDVCVGKGFGTGPDGRQWPNACRGDSGGPLMCKRGDGSWQVDGVASFVYTYCKYYTAYSPVNKYLDWINSYIKN